MTFTPLSAIKRTAYLILFALCSIAPTQATQIYTLSLEWPLDSSYNLDVSNQSGQRLGITITPVLQFSGKNRQTVIVVPDVAVCSEKALRLMLSVNALLPKQAATLSITADQEVIYQESINTSLSIELPEIDNTICQAIDNDIYGVLTIAVAKPEKEVTLNWASLIQGDVGHAWIEFRALSALAPIAYATAGTYSSVVGDKVFNGINFFREIYRPASTYKTVLINKEQWQHLVVLIDSYVAQGTTTWTPWHNCTQFATDAWYAATGEFLSATRLYPNAPWEVTQMGFPNAVSLYYSILEQGGIRDEDQ
ncbi:MAG: hypothetical protein K9L22_00875 [Methylococcaceae bacterium]|nr:hypothetical protein [Methylococcaceae bacterium]